MKSRWFLWFVAIVFVACGFLLLDLFRWSPALDIAPAVQRTEAVNNMMTAEAVTSAPPTEAVQTNGLVRVRDVGGTISFQQSSSKASAPVAPENPYLTK